VIDGERLKRIESLVLKLEAYKDIDLLGEFVAGFMKNPIA
jgi:hypothetical protein